MGRLEDLTRRSRTIGWASLAVVAIMLVGACPWAGADDDATVPVIVVFKDTVDRDLVEDAGGSVDIEFETFPGVATELTSKAIAKLERSSKVARVEEDGTVYALVDADKKPDGVGGGGKPQKQSTPWGITKINADEAWSTTMGATINVAILDTGVDKDHPDLEANIAGGENFVPSGGTVDPTAYEDDHGHGTHCAGVVAAIDNTLGVVGVAPEVNIWALKVLNRYGTGEWSWLIDAIEWCIATHEDSDTTNDIHVISMSLGATGTLPEVGTVCEYAYAEGIVLVASAGNSGGSSGDETVGYPAKYETVIAVGATDKRDVRASFSSVGDELELVAPGVRIKSTVPDDSYGTMSGTSMACPHVAGTVALLLTMDPSYYNTGWGPSWEPAEVRARLIATATDLGDTGWDDLYGNGRVDALAAITV